MDAERLLKLRSENEDGTGLSIDEGTQIIDEAISEKQRRVYYQDIVYAVCNKLDRVYTPPCVCGTVNSPTTQVQERLESLIEYRDEKVAECDKLRKILSFVPGRIALEATEKAGFGSAVHTMARPSTGHPPAERRCGICGGVVHFDGTAPDPACWPAGKKNRSGEQ